ncbi:MAG: hypothetical protein GY830_08030 [Bacteroidetes bacterium]|nr:hypothetical protein [Bacteroidota bacterium]
MQRLQRKKININNKKIRRGEGRIKLFGTQVDDIDRKKKERIKLLQTQVDDIDRKINLNIVNLEKFHPEMIAYLKDHIKKYQNTKKTYQKANT